MYNSAKAISNTKGNEVDFFKRVHVDLENVPAWITEYLEPSSVSIITRFKYLFRWFK